MKKILFKKINSIFIFYFLTFINFYNCFSSEKKKSINNGTTGKEIIKEKPKNTIAAPVEKSVASQFDKLVKNNKLSGDLLKNLSNFYFDKSTWKGIEKFRDTAPSNETFNELIEIIKNKLNSTTSINDSIFKKLIEDSFTYISEDKLNSFSKDQFLNFLKKIILFLIKKNNFEKYSSQENIDIKKNFILNFLFDLGAKSFFEKKFPKKNETDLLKKNFNSSDSDETKKDFLKGLIEKDKNFFINKNEYSDYLEIFSEKLLLILNIKLKKIFPESTDNEENNKSIENNIIEEESKINDDIKSIEKIEQKLSSDLVTINEQREKIISAKKASKEKKNIIITDNQILKEIYGTKSKEDLISLFDEIIPKLDNSSEAIPFKDFIDLIKNLNSINKNSFKENYSNKDSKNNLNFNYKNVDKYLFILDKISKNDLLNKIFLNLNSLLNYIKNNS